MDYAADLGRGVSGYFEYDGAVLRAHVRNDTGYRLGRCRIVRTRSEGPSKDLRSGQSATLEFAANRSAALPNFSPGTVLLFSPRLGRDGNLLAIPRQSVLAPNARNPPRVGGSFGLVRTRIPVENPPAHQGSQSPLGSSAHPAESGKDDANPRMADRQPVRGILRLGFRGRSLTRIRTDRNRPWRADRGIHASSGREAGAGASLEVASGAGLPAADLSAYDYAHGSWQTLAHNSGAAVPSSGGPPTGPRPNGSNAADDARRRWRSLHRERRGFHILRTFSAPRGRCE